MVALLATGGSTNHLIHLPAIAASAGIVIDWEDFDRLSKVVPLLTRVYPNGSADVNAFQAAGGPPFVISELLTAGLLHPALPPLAGTHPADYRRTPAMDGETRIRPYPPHTPNQDNTD